MSKMIMTKGDYGSTKIQCIEDNVVRHEHILSRRFEEKVDYNECGQRIHFVDNTGLEQWWEYDSQGNNVYYKEQFINKEKSTNTHLFITEFEMYISYDEYGNKVDYKDYSNAGYVAIM